MAVDAIQSAESKEQAAEASKLIKNALQQVRSISHLLHPPFLDEMGLELALRSYVEGLTQRSGIETSLDVQPSDFPRSAPEIENAIFRIVQESLTNTFRHSEARKVCVTLAISDSQITVAVCDDGKGIPRHIMEFQPGSVGVGIGGMRQRVRELGGVLRLQNANPGTRVEVVIPNQLAERNRAEATP
jgi:signal transduction histidine kinase